MRSWCPSGCSVVCLCVCASLSPSPPPPRHPCVCACVRVCVRACVRVCVCAAHVQGCSLRGRDAREGACRLPERGARGGGGGQVALGPQRLLCGGVCMYVIFITRARACARACTCARTFMHVHVHVHMHVHAMCMPCHVHVACEYAHPYLRAREPRVPSLRPTVLGYI